MTRFATPASTFSWQSTAKLHHGLKAASGTLVLLGKNGIEFHSENPRISHVWPYLEVKTLALSPHRVIITDYGNRGHRLPGERRFPSTLVHRFLPLSRLALRRKSGSRYKTPTPRLKSQPTSAYRPGTERVLVARMEPFDFVTTPSITCPPAGMTREVGDGQTFRRLPIQLHTGCGWELTLKPLSLS